MQGGRRATQWPFLQPLYRGFCSLAADVVSSTNPLLPPAFVFDIDGVLIRGKHVLPAALKAMSQLYSPVSDSWRYPVCFITNGGGVTEEKKARQLSEWLNVNVHSDQVILSHTPMQGLAARYAQCPVLVAGRGDVLHVAQTYGFHKAFTTQQLGLAMPTAIPFSPYQGELPLGRCPVRDLGYGTAAEPIGAVLVMTDPSDWYRDLQLLCDVISANGVPTAMHPPEGSEAVHVYFSNPDLLWANEFPRPRFGQGAFSTALQALYHNLTGAALRAHWFGKPNAEPYRLAERRLLSQALHLGLFDPAVGASRGPQPVSCPGDVRRMFSTIYAVGDNPAADVRGANRAGAPWLSVLVRTGVYAGGPVGGGAEDQPAVTVADVADAVTAALHRTRHAK